MSTNAAVPAGYSAASVRIRARYPTLLLWFLVAGAALSGMSFDIGGGHVRIDQAASILLVVRLGAETLLGRKLYLDAAFFWLVGYLSITALSSVWAPDSRNSLLQTLNLSSMAAIYLLLTNYLKSNDALGRFWQTFLVVGTVAITVGLLLFVAVLLGFAGEYMPFSIWTGYGAYGTMREPNIFGGFAALFLLLGIALIARPRSAVTTRARRWVLILLFVAGGGLIFSFTRASWVGALSVLLPTLVSLRRRVRLKVVVPLLAAIAVAVAIAASPLVPGDYLRYKVTNLVDFQDGTGAGRLAIWSTALEETQQRPWIGWGTYSFGDLHKEGTEASQELPWIGNFAVTVLHDSGIIGSLFFGAFLVVTVRGGLRDAKRLWKHAPETAVRLVGLCYGVVALLIAFLATTGFSFGYPWIALGLIGAYRRRARQILAVPGGAVIGDASV